MDNYNTEQEVWKGIDGYEGYYQISNLGRVKSLDRVDSIGHKRKGKIMKLTPFDGYLNIILTKNAKRKRFKVHRLVAETFIPNPEMNPTINHKDEVRSNNKVKNLEWCTDEYNVNYGNRTKKYTAKRTKPILRISIDGKEKKIYGSMKEVSEDGFDRRNVHSCIKGRLKKTGNYIWKYLEDAD